MCQEVLCPLTEFEISTLKPASRDCGYAPRARAKSHNRRRCLPMAVDPPWIVQLAGFDTLWYGGRPLPSVRVACVIAKLHLRGRHEGSY